MLDKIKYRIAFVALAIGAIYFFYTYGIDLIQPYGNVIAENPDNEVLWGLTWITQNVGWIVVIIVALAFLILMAWQIYKDRNRN